MKTEYLISSIITLLLTVHMTRTSGTDDSTRNLGSFSKQTNANNTSSQPPTTIADDHSRTDTTMMTAQTPAIYSTGTLSADEFKRIREMQSYFYLTVEPMAVVLLSLCAVAFLRDRQFASNCYLAALCLSQAWYMLMLFVHYCCWKRTECYESHSYVQMSIWSVTYTAMAARRCVYILNGLVSFQRYVTVALPWRIRCLHVFQKPRLPLMVVFLSSFLLHIYRPLQYAPTPVKGSAGDRWTRGYSDRYRSHEGVFKALYKLVKYLMVYLPMLVCLISNCLMIFALRKQQNLRKKNEPMCQERCSMLSHPADDITFRGIPPAQLKRQVTVTILVSTFLMLFFNTPININEAVSIYSDDYGLLKKDHYLYLVLRSCFSIISQSCEILVTLSYLIISTMFRRRFVALFRPLRRVLCCCKPAARAHSGYMSETSVTAAHSITQAGTMELDTIAKGEINQP